MVPHGSTVGFSASSNCGNHLIACSRPEDPIPPIKLSHFLMARETCRQGCRTNGCEEGSRDLQETEENDGSGGNREEVVNVEDKREFTEKWKKIIRWKWNKRRGGCRCGSYEEIREERRDKGRNLQGKIGERQ